MTDTSMTTPPTIAAELREIAALVKPTDHNERALTYDEQLNASLRIRRCADKIEAQQETELAQAENIEHYQRQLEAALEQQTLSMSMFASKADYLFEFLEHGDDAHRAWLHAACKAFFAGEPRPVETPKAQPPTDLTEWQRGLMRLVDDLPAKVGQRSTDAERRAAFESHAAQMVQRVAELEDERSKRLMGDTMITDMQVRDGSLSLSTQGGAASLLAEMLAEQYKQANGINYVEFQFASVIAMPGERFVVTAQRVDGKTPHELRKEADSRCEAAEKDRAMHFDNAKALQDRLEAAEKDAEPFPMSGGPAIPWRMAKAIYAGYQAIGCGNQPLQTIADRGGFGWSEVDYIYRKPSGRKAIDAAIAAAKGLTLGQELNPP